MDVQVEDVAPCRKRLSVEMDPGEVDAAFEESFREVSTVAQVPGFRRGRVPRRVLERRFLGAVRDEVRDRLFRRGLAEAVQKQSLSPLGMPRMDEREIACERGEPFRFSAELDVRPEFELSDYKGLELTERVVPVADEEVQARLDELRERFADHVPVDEPAQEGDLVEGEVALRVGEEELFHEEERALRVEGTTLFGMEAGDLVKALGGVKPGETRTMEFPLSDDHPREDLRGKPATATVSVARVLRTRVPDADDAFAKRLGVADAAALRERLRESLESERRQSAREDLERQMLDKLLEANTFEVPQALVDRQAEASLSRHQAELARLGMPTQVLEERRDELASASREGAQRSIRRMILFDAVADKEGVEVTDQEVQSQVARLAQHYRTTPAKMAKRIEEQDGMEAVRREIRDMKVTELVLGAAQIRREEAPAETDEEPEAAPAREPKKRRRSKKRSKDAKKQDEKKES